MKRREKNEKYKYGNYDKYYLQRNCARWSEPRIQLLRKEWFSDKDVLDIGCNDGTLTILIAQNYDPKHILGIEIDHKLVNRAVENTVYIEKCRNQLIAEKDRIEIIEELETLPKSFQMYLNFPNYIKALRDLIPMKTLISSSPGRFPSNISFRNENYIKTDSDKEYDIILCLSTVKWIHLNWGDSGVKRLFDKVYISLRPNGLFVFEPQPWKSYKKSRTRTEQIFENYHKILFKPIAFHDYLSATGFKLIKTLSPEHPNETFKRDILVYQKGK